MSVLQALGIDTTVLYQFVIAGFTFFALSALVFKPYADALTERDKRTKGGEEEAQNLVKQAGEMRAQYEQKAREMNTQVKTIFDSYRDESSKEYEAITAKARAESQKLIDEARQRVSVQITEASQKMKEEIPQLAQAMASKLLSKKA